MKKYLIAAGCIGFVVTVAAIGWYEISLPARETARNLTAVNGLSVGRTTETELLERKEFQRVERSCYQENCMYRMQLDNHLLNRLHLAPYMWVATFVRVKDGLVADVFVVIARAGRPTISLHQAQALPKGCSAFPCIKTLTAPNKAVLGSGIIFDNASDIRNHLPQAINSQCLSRLQGCTTIAEVVPLVTTLRMEETASGALKPRD